MHVSDCSPVLFDSSVGNALAGKAFLYKLINALYPILAAYEFLIKKNTGKHIDVSRLFIYYNGRKKDGLQDYNMKDGGTRIPNAIEALAEFGCCKEELFPFDITNVNHKPPEKCYEDAKNYRIKEGMQLRGDLDEMKACLAQGYPFVFGLALFNSFIEAETNGGRVPMPVRDDNMGKEFIGDHAMLAAGYSDRSNCFIVQNSAGAEWVSFSDKNSIMYYV